MRYIGTTAGREHERTLCFCPKLGSLFLHVSPSLRSATPFRSSNRGPGEDRHPGIRRRRPCHVAAAAAASAGPSDADHSVQARRAGQEGAHLEGKRRGGEPQPGVLFCGLFGANRRKTANKRFGRDCGRVCSCSSGLKICRAFERAKRQQLAMTAGCCLSFLRVFKSGPHVWAAKARVRT